MTQKIAILGATGSIGTSTLDILARYTNPHNIHPNSNINPNSNASHFSEVDANVDAGSVDYEVYALSGYSRMDELFELCQRFRPKRVAVPDSQVDAFAQRLANANISSNINVDSSSKSNLNIDVVGGQAGLIDIASDTEVDTLVAGIVGSAGLASTLAGVQAGKRVLLANKEALVMAGDLMMHMARQSGAVILPIDSEHNAIFQCLPAAVQTDNRQIHHAAYGIRHLWLTASGGPFLHQTFADMQSATVEQAVKHPNWSMGQKISVDSATMMNKGLELIEACYLFDLPEDKIKVAIHPQSIIHSMVEYADGSFLAQMGSPDMRTPIAHCLAYPQRIDSGVEPLDLFAMSQLEFVRPDLQKFACLRLAREAMLETQKGKGNWANISLNASNEVAVEAFLQKHIRLTDIAHINTLTLEAMKSHSTTQPNSLDEIMHIDALARNIAREVAEKQ